MDRAGRTSTIAAAGVYVAACAILWAAAPDAAGDALVVFGIFAIAFPLLAAALLWRSKPIASPDTSTDAVECALVAVLLLLVSVMLATAGRLDAWVGAGAFGEMGRAAFVLARKLTLFVALPWVILRAVRGRTAADFGLSYQALRSLWGRHGIALAGLVVVATAFQLFGGRAAQPIRDGTLRGQVLVLSLVLSLAWNVVEAGLVEEFFFRAVLQSRLALLLRSELAAGAVACVLFGIAHAPGYILRGGAISDGLGAHPSAWVAVAYAIAVPSAAGVLFAYLWTRTRNLYVGILLHGAIDAIPNAAATAQMLGLS